MRTGAASPSKPINILRHSFELSSSNTFKANLKVSIEKLADEHPGLKDLLIRDPGFCGRFADRLFAIFKDRTDTLFIMFDPVFVKEPARLTDLLARLENTPGSKFTKKIEEAIRSEYPHTIEAKFCLNADNNITCELIPKTILGTRSLNFYVRVTLEDPTPAPQAMTFLEIVANHARKLLGLDRPDQ